MRRGFRKYHNKPTVVDGHRFASKAEAARYVELKLMQQAGEIAELVLQPRFKLMVNGHKICFYVSDFRYRIAKTGEAVVEDVKGAITPTYRIKKALMNACHGITITEVR